MPTPRPAPPPPRPEPGRDDSSATAPAPTAVSTDEALATLGRIVLGERPLGEVTRQVCELAVATIPGAAQASVTLVRGQRARTAAFTGADVAALDERQYELGFGPCLDAARTGSTVHVIDTSDCAAYPDFAALAARHRITSVLSIGLPVPGRSVGALNMCCTGGKPLGASAVELARLFACYAAVALANASRFADAQEHSEQMRQAMASRSVIEQAKGVLIAREGLDPEAAFAHLARLSQDSNRKLHEIAAQVVADAHGPPGRPPT